MIFHDCPGSIIRKPISFCSHVHRVYLWLWTRTRLRIRIGRDGQRYWIEIGVRRWTKMDEELSRLFQTRDPL